MIIPAILEVSWEEIEKKIEICQEFANTIHVDFIDGKFAPSLTFMDPTRFLKYSNYFTLEAHIMMDEPINFLEPLKLGGFRRFIGHVEKMSDQVDFVAKAETMGAVGLGIDLATPVSNIEIPLSDLDQVLLMSVPAGKSGQTFDNSVIEKLIQLRRDIPAEVKIEVDGGINDKTLIEARKAGASMFCVTSFLFKENPKEQYELLSSI
jgi:ribulose-phosphate 3-epimerase